MCVALPSLQSLSHLVVLDASYMGAIGTLLQDSCDLYHGLAIGTFPMTLATLTKLKTLDLSHSTMSELQSLASIVNNLEHLDLSYGALTGG